MSTVVAPLPRNSPFLASGFNCETELLDRSPDWLTELTTRFWAVRRAVVRRLE